MGYKEHTMHETRVNKAVTKSFKSYRQADPYSWGDLELLMKMNALAQNDLVLQLTKTTGNERRNVTFQQECTEALWVAVCFGPERRWLVDAEYNEHIQSCRSTGKSS